MSNKLVCDDCGGNSCRVIKSKKFGKTLCNRCYCKYTKKLGLVVHKLPAFGKIEYDDEGKPICHICGRSYRKLMSHVNQKHDMGEREYKLQFGLDTTKGILDNTLRERHREIVLDNYESHIKNNLITKGKDSRFTYGDSKGKYRDVIRYKAMLKLKQSIISMNMSK